MEIIIVIAAVVAAYLIWTHLTKEVAVPKDLVQSSKLDDDLTAYAAPYKVLDPEPVTIIPLAVAAPVAAPVAEKPKRKPAAKTVAKPAAKTAAPKKTVAKPAAAKKTAAVKKPAAKKKSV